MEENDDDFIYSINEFIIRGFIFALPTRHTEAQSHEPNRGQRGSESSASRHDGYVIITALPLPPLHAWL